MEKSGSTSEINRKGTENKTAEIILFFINLKCNKALRIIALEKLQKK